LSKTNTSKSIIMGKVSWINQVFFAAIVLLLAADCKKEITPIDIEYPITHWPVVKTLVVTNINSAIATLNGTVNGYGLPTTVTFEYGTTTSYGNTVTASESPVTQNDVTGVSADISGLTPHLTYHYRIKAENSKWINFYSSDATFIQGQPPTVTTLSATNISSIGATLNGTVNAHGFTTTVTFECTMVRGGKKTVTAVQSPVTGDTDILVTADISGLAPGTAHSFRVIATNSCGMIYGNFSQFAVIR
jgi:phosphodiesterase/alkaline phosphatase D-like protein